MSTYVFPQLWFELYKNLKTMNKTETITIENRGISIVVNGQVFHSDEVPIVIIFPDDNLRKVMGRHLTEMAPKVTGFRSYAVMPDVIPDKDEVIPQAIKLYLADLDIDDPSIPPTEDGTFKTGIL